MRNPLLREYRDGDGNVIMAYPRAVARRCPFDVLGGPALTTDDNVPLLKRRVDDGQGHQFT